MKYLKIVMPYLDMKRGAFILLICSRLYVSKFVCIQIIFCILIYLQIVLLFNPSFFIA